ncbi:MAG TPA: esterase-like activity of phytase family protein [Rubellimicrobium sp.]|nr:esterase-like activity of phytase family protein [Rubellimicrobium sp.]
MLPRLTCLTSALALAAGSAWADPSFNRVSSFATPDNIAEGEDASSETSAEIIAASEDGMTLIYTDSPLGVVGMIDITDPASPAPKGNLAMNGEPTSVAVLGSTAFVAVNTSDSYTEPSGALATVDMATGAETARCDLGGQPDSVAVAKDGSFLAIAIENERDEDAGDGRVPQMPAGFVAILPLTDGAVDCSGLVKADVTGLAEIAPEDPEPEYIDINEAGEIVVTLQENNHIAVLDRTGAVLSDVSAGAVDLDGIDTAEDGAIAMDDSAEGVLREPDGVKWIDDTHFATANEGDMDGGSRGWTVWSKDGQVVWDSGNSFEHAVARIGHYPEGRSDAKGAEPESIAVATFDGTPLVFVESERASVVGVYDVTDPANPVLLQMLPSGIGPEGLAAIPARGLIATANETDLGGDALARAHVMLFQRAEGAPTYPTITSAGADHPIAWGALSGLVADPDQPGRLYAVSDSAYEMAPTIYTIDASQTPAQITEAVVVTRGGAPAQKLDLEGVALDGEGGFWLANEGRTDQLVPHALLHVDAEGAIQEEVAFPPELLSGETRFGAEGLTMLDGTLWIAVQREWGDDSENAVKLVAYTPETGEWGAVRYEKAAPTGEGWVGLSEIVAHGDWVYLIERDNHTGANAATKLVTRVPRSEMSPAPLGGELPLVSREVVRDLIPDLQSSGGFVLEKIEGMAISPDGTAWLVTDNDGVDDSTGETLFWSIGPVE